jgi:stress response protein YsnF
MSGDIRIPIVEEEALVTKRQGATEHVSVQTRTSEHEVVVRDTVRHEHVEVTRVPVEREVAEAPGTRVEGDLTVISVMEERLVVEKRLFVVEELHLRRTSSIDPVELPVTLRRTDVEIDRETIHNQENI